MKASSGVNTRNKKNKKTRRRLTLPMTFSVPMEALRIEFREALIMILNFIPSLVDVRSIGGTLIERCHFIMMFASVQLAMFVSAFPSIG